MTVRSPFDDAYRRPGPGFGLRPDPAFARLVLESGVGGQTLDLGAGDGRNTVFLAAHGFTVDAIDLSGRAVERLGKLAQQVRLDTRASMFAREVARRRIAK